MRSYRIRTPECTFNQSGTHSCVSALQEGEEDDDNEEEEDRTRNTLKLAKNNKNKIITFV